MPRNDRRKDPHGTWIPRTDLGTKDTHRSHGTRMPRSEVSEYRGRDRAHMTRHVTHERVLARSNPGLRALTHTRCDVRTGHVAHWSRDQCARGALVVVVTWRSGHAALWPRDQCARGALVVTCALVGFASRQKGSDLARALRVFNSDGGTDLISENMQRNAAHERAIRSRPLIHLRMNSLPSYGTVLT